MDRDSPFRIPILVKGAVVGDDLLISTQIGDQLYEKVFRAEDQLIRDGLIRLGWTPPVEDKTVAMPPNERKTLSGLLEKLGDNVIMPHIDRKGNLLLKSKSTGRTLMTCNVDDIFDADGNRFERDVEY